MHRPQTAPRRILTTALLPGTAAIISLLCSCTGVGGPDPSYACYESRHFGIYYKESEFSIQEVQTNADRKERLLAHINGQLEVNFNGFIRVYLHLTGGSWANTDMTIHESRAYVLADDGHEIVHIVARQTLGGSTSAFLREGLAMAVELEFDYDNVMERFLVYRCTPDSSGTSQSELETRTVIDVISHDTFDYSYASYLAAGAFVKDLIIRYGIDKVKQWYIASAGDRGPAIVTRFTLVFGTPLEREEEAFRESCRCP